MSHKPSNKSVPIKARVKTKITLYDELGGAFQQLANLYQLSYEQLAERMILAGVQSHLQAINDLQNKTISQDEKGESNAAVSETNESPSPVPAE